jgi:hypothetical protein
VIDGIEKEIREYMAFPKFRLSLLIAVCSIALFFIATIPQNARPALGQTSGPVIFVESVGDASVYQSGNSVILALSGQSQVVLSPDDALALANALEQAATLASENGQ